MARTGSRYSSSARAGGPAVRRSAISGDIPEALTALLALQPRGWIVSCYQKLEPGDRAGDKYRIKLKNRLRRAADRLGILGFGHADREQVTAALAAVEDFFAHSTNLPASRGLAVFAGRGLFRAVALPQVLRSRVLVDRSPVVSELVAATEAGTGLLVAIADRRSARLFAVGLSGIEELDGMIAPEASRSAAFHPQRGDAPGVGEFRFQSRIREEKHRHLARVADAVARAWRTRAYDGLVVGGIGVDAAALLPHLHSDARDRVIGVLRLAPRQATAAAVREAALALWADAAEAATADVVGEYQGLVESGWAVRGVEAALKALARGQVRTLLVDHDAELPGYRFALSGRLSALAAGTRGDGEALPVADLLDDAIEDALRQRVRVALVRGPAARAVDRLGAILRFRTAK